MTENIKTKTLVVKDGVLIKLRSRKIEVQIPIQASRVERNAFAFNDYARRVFIHKGVTSIEEGAFSDCFVEKVEVEEGNPRYYVEGNCLIDKETETLILGCPDSVIPSHVKRIGCEAFYGRAFYKELNLPEVTSIGPGAFRDCRFLTKVNLPETLLEIGHAAFADCQNLESVHIPSSVTHIGSFAFGACEQLANIEVSENNPAFFSKDNALIEKDGMRLLALGINNDIPEGVKIIGEDAFRGDKRKTLALPIGIKVIEPFAFAGAKIASLSLPEGLETIADCAFLSEESITSISFPKSLKYLHKSAFANCTELKEAFFGDCEDLYIGPHAFSSCSSLFEVKLPDTTYHLGRGAFLRCEFLYSINIPSCLTSIEERTFCGCKSLKSIEIPDGISTIGAGAFECCSSLDHVLLNDGLETVDRMAFDSCHSLKEICFPKSIVNIHRGAFSTRRELITLYLPKGFEGHFDPCVHDVNYWERREK